MTVGEATQLLLQDIQCDTAMATASASMRVTRQLSFIFSMVWGGMAPCPPLPSAHGTGVVRSRALVALTQLPDEQHY